MQIDGESTDPKSQWKAWEKATSAQIIDSINALRDRHGLTVRDLAGRLDAYGWPVDVATLNGILGSSKRQSIGVAELYAFARALSVTPLYLLLGIPKHGTAVAGPVFDNRAATNVELMQWFNGNSPFALSTKISQDAAAQRFDEEVQDQSSEAVYQLFRYGNTLQAIEWHNAALIELQTLDPDHTLDGIPGTRTAGFLRLQIESLLEQRHDLSSKFFVPLPDLPEPLALIYESEDLEAVELPIQGLSSDQMRKDARAQIRKRLGSETSIRLGRDDGSSRLVVGYAPNE